MSFGHFSGFFCFDWHVKAFEQIKAIDFDVVMSFCQDNSFSALFRQFDCVLDRKRANMTQSNAAIQRRYGRTSQIKRKLLHIKPSVVRVYALASSTQFIWYFYDVCDVDLALPSSDPLSFPAHKQYTRIQLCVRTKWMSAARKRLLNVENK